MNFASIAGILLLLAYIPIAIISFQKMLPLLVLPLLQQRGFKVRGYSKKEFFFLCSSIYRLICFPLIGYILIKGSWYINPFLQFGVFLPIILLIYRSARNTLRMNDQINKFIK